MVISRKYEYVFIELPRTGTVSISSELVQHYAGENILTKHGTYGQFKKKATEEEKCYFVFSCIRDPIDRTYSFYNKFKYHYFHDLNGPQMKKRISGLYLKRMAKDVRERGFSFVDFVKRFNLLPYCDWSCLDHRKFDSIIRFENIQADFEKVLRSLKIDPVRRLPKKNVTREKMDNYISAVGSRHIEYFKNIFGPFMREWGFEMPSSWGDYQASWVNELKYALGKQIRSLYWKYLYER